MNFLLIGLLVSQNLFARTYGGTSGDYARSIIQTPDGGYAVMGGTSSFGASSSDLLLIKLDNTGNLLWARTFGGDSSDGARCMTGTADGGFVIAGSTRSYGAGNSDFLILRLDSSGNLAWARVFGGTDMDWPTSIAQAPDGGFVVAGGARSFGVGYYNMLVLKLSAPGDLEWARAYGTTTGSGSAASIIQASGGGYLLGGTLGGALIMRIDSSGSPIWTRVFDEFAFSTDVFPLIQTPDGGYAIAGALSFYDLADAGSSYVIKMDSSGNVEWAKAYDMDTGITTCEGALSMALAPDEGFIVGGCEWNLITYTSCLLLFRTSASGEVIHAMMFGDTGKQYPQSMIRVADGGYVLSGEMAGDLLVMKLDTAGDYPDCLRPYVPLYRNVTPTVVTPSLVVTVCSLSVDTPDLTITTPDLAIMDVCPPNLAEETGAPPSGSLTLLPAPGGFYITGYEGSARIYDPAGRLVLSQEINGKTLISPLKPGVYFVVAGKGRARIAVR